MESSNGVQGGVMTTVTEQSKRQARRSSRAAWLLVGALAAAVTFGAVAGALREPARLDAATPEGVTQAYLQAVLDRNYTTAAGYFADSLAAECDAADFRRAWVEPNLTAALDDVTVAGDTAEVRVRLRSVAGPAPFGAGGYESLETFFLVSEAGQWRITGPAWPLFDCWKPESKS